MKYLLLVLVAIALCSAQSCPNLGDIRDCNNTCVPSTWVGDSRCDNGPPYGSLNCYLFGCDGGDCQPNQCAKTCPNGQIVDCVGKCVASTLVGNGVCNNDTTARFDCAKYSCDGGDCGSCTSCPVGYIVDCNGNCGLAKNIGDYTCDNGAVNFNCSQYSFDLGDCVTCPSGQRSDCNNVCITPSQAYSSRGNGVCNPRFNCLKFGYDGNDCNSCSTGQVKDCTGSCVSATSLGNGACNANFNCQGYNFDEGDCSNCDPQFVPDCLGHCAEVDLFGDPFCDYTSPNFNCSKYNYDNTTCLSQVTPVTTGSTTCPTGYIFDCNGVCQNSDFVGDGQCDDGTFGAVFNCQLFNCDGGDCLCISTSGGRTTGLVTTGRGLITTGTPGITTASTVPAPITTGVVQGSTTAASSNTNNVFTTGEAIGEQSSDTGLSSGAVAGIVIGSLIGAVIVFLVIGFLVVSRRPSKYKLRAADQNGDHVDLDDHHKGTDLDK